MPFRQTQFSLHAAGRAALVFTLASFAALGCQPAEQISKYTAPKDPVDFETISDDPEPGDPKVRILGAIAETDKPGGNDWYFFKFQPSSMGATYPPRAIERHAADFETFLKSVKFPAGKDPTWTLPAGWRSVEVKSGIPRIATLRMRKSETVVDLAVSSASGGLLDNINRWRNQQAGADPITEAEIPTKCKVLTIDGRKVVIVDVSGPGPKPGAMKPPFAK